MSENNQSENLNPEMKDQNSPEATNEKAAEVQPETVEETKSTPSNEGTIETSETIEEVKATEADNLTETEPISSEAITSEADNIEKVPEISEKAKEETPVIEEAKEDKKEEEDAKIEEEIDLEAYKQFDKKQLIEAMVDVAQSEKINKKKEQASAIAVAYREMFASEKNAALAAFIEEGGVAEDFKYEQNEEDVQFNDAFSEFKKKSRSQRKEFQNQLQDNLQARHKILEEMRELLKSTEELKITYDRLKKLQNEWSDLGQVPTNEKDNLWKSYFFLVEKFLDRVKIDNELRDKGFKNNLEEKIKLCEEAEELLLETSINKSFRSLQHLHEKWKEIGQVPHDKNEEIWERFKATSDKINERRKEFYIKLHDEQDNNLKAKRAICEELEALVGEQRSDLKAWNAATDKANEMFALWKSVGMAPKAENDKIWARFRASMDKLYAGKKEFMGGIKDEQSNNYAKKMALCAEAESLQNSTDWRNSTQALINLQKQWKVIGPVPRKHSDTIWKRFRKACDTFFNAKEAYFANIHVHENENMESKKVLIEEIKNMAFGGDKDKALEAIKEIQKRWADIGHVPMAKKDALQTQFRKAIDAHLEDLKISSDEIRTLDYRARMDHLKKSGQADRLLSKERGHLMGQISKLSADINLWENNIGFLASSKNADILKVEFQKKIDKAKDELELLNVKLKMLKQG